MVDTSALLDHDEVIREFDRVTDAWNRDVDLAVVLELE